MSLPIEVEMRLVNELERAITAFWEPHGFINWKRHEWIRRWGWKTDWIRAVHRKRCYMLINFSVELPPNGDGIREYVGASSLGLLAGRDTQQDFPFPRFAKLTGRFVPSIMALMPLAVTWYEGFNNSTKCMELQQADPWVNPNSPAFKYCQHYLQSLPADAAKGCCLLNLEHEYYDEYCRSMFDVRWQGPPGKMADEEQEPELKVGAPVLDQYDAEATIVAIDPEAVGGQGTVTIRYDEDGYVDSLPLDDSSLKIDQSDRSDAK